MNEAWKRQPSIAANCNPSTGKEDWSQPARTTQQYPNSKKPNHQNQNKPGETKHYGKTVIQQTLQFYLHRLSGQVNPRGQKGTPLLKAVTRSDRENALYWLWRWPSNSVATLKTINYILWINLMVGNSIAIKLLLTLIESEAQDLRTPLVSSLFKYKHQISRFRGFIYVYLKENKCIDNK